MKKIYLYILAAALTLAGCEKYLEVEPTNVRALKTYEDAKSLMGGYLRMFTGVSADKMEGVTIPWQNTNSYMYFAYLSDDLDTDYVMMSKSGDPKNSPFADLFLGSLNWKSPTMPGILWDEHYLNIGFLNTVIDETALVEATDAQKDIVVMEAKFLRAWYIFKLLQYFSPYKDDRLGLPLNLDSKSAGSYEGSRRTQTECYRIVIDELTGVLNCNTPARKGYNIFYDKDMVNALLAQVYHFKGGSGAAAADDYDNAIAHAKAVLAAHPLTKKDEYTPFVEVPDNTYGMIGGLPAQPALVTAFSHTADTNRPFWSSPVITQVTDEFYALFNDGDVRKVHYFWNWPVDANIDRALKKFMPYGWIDPYYESLDMKFNFFHLADMHLIVAECLALRNKPEAKTWLDDFRKERYSDYTPYAGSDTLEEILRERRREFAFEYDMRWLDLRRYPKGWTRRSYQDFENPTYTIKADDYRWCLPIPVNEELQYNKIEQNPGWGMF